MTRTKTDRILGQLRGRPRPKAPIAANLILPNNSGDHQKSIKRNAPINNIDLVNKEYVDTLTTNHPHQNVNTTASPTFKILNIGNSNAYHRINFYAGGSPTGASIVYDNAYNWIGVNADLAVSGRIFSTSTISTTGAGDDFWLGNTTQASASFQAYANGNLTAKGITTLGSTGQMSIDASGNLETTGTGEFSGLDIVTGGTAVIYYGDGGPADSLRFQGRGFIVNDVAYGSTGFANTITAGLNSTLASWTINENFIVISNNENIELKTNTAAKKITFTTATIDVNGADVNLDDNKLLTFGGTITDMQLSSDGTNGLITAATSIRLGTATTNYTKVEADGTLEFNGNATVWDDLRTPINAVKVPTTKAPTWTAYSAGLLLGFTDQAVEGNEEEVYFTVQLPHSYKEGTDITPHIHWLVDSGTIDQDCRWGLEYEWVNIDASFSGTTTIHIDANLDANDRHLVNDFAAISGAAKTISSMLVCRLFRNSSHENDTLTTTALLLEIDFHFEKDMIGSRQITTK